ncbi:MAG: hypothetical protein U0905_16610 [Pirellulales bacterium]
MLYAHDAEHFVFIMPAFPTEVITLIPTGAGDCFWGECLGMLPSRNQVDETSRQRWPGTVLASFNVEGFSLERLWDVDHNHQSSYISALHDRVLNYANLPPSANRTTQGEEA